MTSLIYLIDKYWTIDLNGSYWIMSNTLLKQKANFGTAPVFMTAISTILGAILYLRFGYAVAHTGFMVYCDYYYWSFGYNSNCNGCCRNSNKQKSSRRWSLLYYFKIFWIKYWCCHWNSSISSQAISVAFYVIAFAEAFMPFSEFLIESYPFLEDYSVYLLDKRLIGIIMMVLLSIIMLTKGANIGMNLLTMWWPFFLHR